MKVLVINPGATSTKISIFEDENEIFKHKLNHDSKEMQVYKHIVDQLDYRYSYMKHELERLGHGQDKFDCVIGRGGLLRQLPSGVYAINQTVTDDLVNAKYGEHASNLGILMAKQFSVDNGGIPCYFTNPVSTDEMDEVARVSGFKGMARKSLFHALNHKAAAEKAAAILGKNYEDTKLIVAHLGGGVSVCAHKNGRVTDVYNVKDEGAFALDRCGSIPVNDVIDMCYANPHDKRKVKTILGRQGGVFSYLGTMDLIEVEKMIDDGNEEAALIFEALAYQLAKDMGAMHSTMCGRTEAVVLTGGMAYSERLVERIKYYAGYIGKFIVLPGEFEMEAMAKGALKACRSGESLVY